MILYDAHAELNDWVSFNVLGVTGIYDKASKAIGHVKDGKLIAAVTYNNFRTRPDGSFLTVEMGIFTIDHRWATREFLHAIFDYPFIQLGMPRVQTACSADRPEIIKFNRKMGFTPEGYHRQAWPLGGDSISFSMLRNECRWLDLFDKKENSPHNLYT